MRKEIEKDNISNKKKRGMLYMLYLTMISLVSSVFMVSEGLAQVAGMAYVVDISENDEDKSTNFGMHSLPSPLPLPLHPFVSLLFRLY